MSGQGAGLVIWWSQVQVLHPAIHWICSSVAPSSTPWLHCVNNQLVSLLPVRIFKQSMFISVILQHYWIVVEIVLQYLFYYLTKIISNQISHLACSLIMTILYSLQGTFKNFSHLAQQGESIILEIRLLWVILRPSLS